MSPEPKKKEVMMKMKRTIWTDTPRCMLTALATPATARPYVGRSNGSLAGRDGAGRPSRRACT